ncbi:hypothetical protein DFJ74DRAFT_49683 [Hyaloraphidium curvatum]|nr:hypothetical protein DFJ74DRAFT_49683 [Hyaloraphidium curvatum]
MAAANAPVPAPGVLRPVGQMERYSVSRHNALFYIGIASSLTFRADGGAFSRDRLAPLLAAAIECTTLRHGNLRMVIVGPRTPAPAFSRWEEDSPPELRVLPEPRWVDGGDVLRVSEDELRTPFDAENGPLWRVCVVGAEGADEFSIVVALHHAICDGKSSIVVLATLARYLALGSESAMRAAVAADPNRDFESRAVELACTGVRVPVSVILWEVFENLLLPSFLRPYVAPRDYYAGRRLLPPDAPTFTTEPRTPETLIGVRLANLTLTKDETSALLAAARTNGTTLHGALVAAAAQAVCTASARRPAKIKAASPVSLRAESGVPESEVAVCISSTDFECRLDPVPLPATGLWDLARAARASVAQGRQSSALFTLGLLGYVGDFDGFILKAGMGTPNRKGGSVEVSNAMSWDGFDPVRLGEGEWRVSGGTFAQSASPMGSLFYFGAVSVEGCLSLTASCSADGLVEEGELEEVVAEMGRMLAVMRA